MSKEQQKKALEMIKAVYDDGFAEINGNRYDFAAMTHKNAARFLPSSQALPLSYRGSLLSFWTQSDSRKLNA